MLASALKTVAKAVLPPSARLRVKNWIKESATQVTGPDVRLALSVLFLRGHGIEIGALNRPLPVSKQARVSYVDRLTVAEAREHFRELRGLPLVEPDIITDGETLSGIPDRTQDFVIANHFVEHTQDPIGTLRHLTRVLKSDGVLFMALPDKRYTFDVRRPETTYDHLVRDHEKGTEGSRLGHYEEYVRLALGIEDPEKARKEVQHLMDVGYTIHFHVWTPVSATEFVTRSLERFGRPYELLTMTLNPDIDEMIFVVKILDSK